MRVLGIDPGYARLGYAIVETEQPTLIDYGVITTKKGTPIAERFVEIREGITQLIHQYQPECCCVEKPLFSTGKNTNAGTVHQALGVIYLTLAECGLSYEEYTPSAIKKEITGTGTADKTLIRMHLEQQLGKLKGVDDGWDAIAIALMKRNQLAEYVR